MHGQNQCHRCQRPLAADAVQGLCVECLMRAALDTRTALNWAGAAEPSMRPRSFPAPAPEALRASFPQLEILEFAGQGGMGAVYRAIQKGLDRVVALKILPPAGSATPGFAERFTREARALARLNHPHIIAVHEFGQAGAFWYLVMEFVDGVSLRELLETRKLLPREALSIVPQICEALQYAHDRGVVHRDIKPENILLAKDGQVKIADFGIARILGPDGGRGRLTGEQQVVGTPHYMAPEQVERPGTVDHRADIYSLGVVFYEMLTGELPLGRFQPPSTKSAVDVRLDEVVHHALEKSRSAVINRRSKSRRMWRRLPPRRTGLPAPASQRHRSMPELGRLIECGGCY